MRGQSGFPEIWRGIFRDGADDGIMERMEIRGRYGIMVVYGRMIEDAVDVTEVVKLIYNFKVG